MADKVYLGGTHRLADPRAWSPAGAPKPGDNLTIQSGTVNTTNSDIEGKSIFLDRTGSAPVIFNMKNAFLGAGSPITTVSEDGAVVINTTGNVVNASTIEDAHGALDINVSGAGTFATFDNTGNIIAPAGTEPTVIGISVSQDAAFSNAGQMTATGSGYNDGTIDISGLGAFNNSGHMTAAGGDIFASIGGSFINSGSIGATGASGFAEISFGGSALVNNGTIGGGNVFLGAAGGGVVDNNNTLDSGNGTLTIAAAVKQSASATTNVDDGSLVLESSMSGGNVTISSGMLEFGGTHGSIGFIGEASAAGFSSTLNISAGGTLQFDGTSNLSEMLKGNNLMVYEQPSPTAAKSQIADIHLNSAMYSASSFHVQGSQITYVPPTSGNQQSAGPAHCSVWG